MNRILLEKKNKPFRKGDIFIYVAILSVILALFVPIIIRNKDKPDHIKVFLYDDLILEYDFTSDVFDIQSDKVNYKKTEKGYTVTIKNGNDINVFLIDTEKVSVAMIETNCSTKADCTYLAVTQKGDTIACVPHGLLIVAEKNEADLPIVG